jgi:hypothetical protein
MMTCEKMISYAAVDADRTETIFDAYPFRDGSAWNSRGNCLQLKEGHLANLGYKLTWKDEPQWIPSKMLPVIQIMSSHPTGFQK